MGGHVTAKRTLGAAVGLLALGLSALVLAPTAAVAGGPDVASETYSDHTVECGYPIDISGEFTSAEMSRSRSPRDPTTFLDHARLSFRETWTNTRSGEWFVLRGTSVNLDLKATQIDANVYEYSSIQAGQPFVIEDSAGRIVARDRGVLRVNVLFDTGGDDDPGREFVDFLGLTLGGPHPGFFTDICRYAADLACQAAGTRAPLCLRTPVRRAALSRRRLSTTQRSVPLVDAQLAVGVVGGV